MEGLDIAFYTARAFYHTIHDSLRGAEGARESLHAHPYTYLASVLSLSHLTTVPILQRSPMSDKSIWKHLYIFTYVMNALAAYAVWKVHIGGVFFLVARHVGAMLGFILEVVTTGKTSSSAPGKNSVSSPKRFIKLRRKKPTITLEKAEKSTFIWTLQALLSIPVPTILVSQVLILFLASLGQTLTDGSSPIFVYASTSILSLLLTLPLTPLSPRLHPNLGFIAALIFACSTYYNLLVFPFSVNAPMKVFFQQKVEITPRGGVRVIAELTGVPGYLQLLVHEIPSTWGKEVECKEDKERSQTWTCSWESDLIPSVSGALVNGDLIYWNVTETEEGKRI